ncbi:MAG: hypothetical protein VZR36_00010 [Prevotella sp.]|nr:hypothetical protein [Prevotella sp.]
MKKIMTLAVAVVMSTLSVSAQNGYEETKHEIAISYGIYSNSQILDIYEDLGGVLGGASYDNDKWVGPVGVEYFYHAKPWLGIGGIAVYGNCQQDVYMSKEKIGKSKNNYFTVMPAVKFNWLRMKNFGMYSKLAAGVTFRNMKFESVADKVQNDNDNMTHFNWQATLIGVEAGSPTVRGFAELGVGEQGIACVGLRYKF